MSKVTNAVPISDPPVSPPPAVPPVPPSVTAGQSVQDVADFRLVIEEDKATGSYIYKTLDRRTGEVIQQFPRDEVLKLKETKDYSAGSIVNARA